MKRLVLSVAVVLSACSTTGAPTIRTSADDGEGPMIPNCRNVSAASRVEEYSPQFYHTTWGSAWMEGAAQGFSEGLTNQPTSQAVREAMVSPSVRDGATFNRIPAAHRPFCHAFDADRARVSEIVEDILPLLGNPVERSDKRAGVFRTSDIQRNHIAATWRDNYAIRVEDLGPGRTGVWVYRQVYISRDGQVYNEGISSGHNELWVLTQIADQLSRNQQ